jgi:hypothetical protein
MRRKIFRQCRSTALQNYSPIATRHSLLFYHSPVAIRRSLFATRHSLLAAVLPLATGYSLLAFTIRHWVSTSSGGTLNLSQPSFASAW